jgi:hypothetical protein
MWKEDFQDIGWNTLRQRIYSFNGFWRDIVVFDTVKDDWKVWLDMVNKQYKTMALSRSIVDFEMLEDVWENPGKNILPYVPVDINGLLVYTKMETPEIMESQFEPRYIETEEDNYVVIDYMKALSRITGKEVLLVDERFSDRNTLEQYIRVKGEKAEYNC